MENINKIQLLRMENKIAENKKQIMLTANQSGSGFRKLEDRFETISQNLAREIRRKNWKRKKI